MTGIYFTLNDLSHSLKGGRKTRSLFKNLLLSFWTLSYTQGTIPSVSEYGLLWTNRNTLFPAPFSHLRFNLNTVHCTDALVDNIICFPYDWKIYLQSSKPYLQNEEKHVFLGKTGSLFLFKLNICAPYNYGILLLGIYQITLHTYASLKTKFKCSYRECW